MEHFGTGAVLRALRAQAHLGQSRLVELAFPDKNLEGYRQRLGRLERGDVTPTEEEIYAISDALGKALGRSSSSIREMLEGHPARREEALQHVQVVDYAVCILDGMRNTLQQEEQKLLDEVKGVVDVMKRLVGLVPEKRFWEAFVRWVHVQKAGTQLQTLLGWTPMEKHLDEDLRVSFGHAIDYLQGLQVRKDATSPATGDEKPIDAMVLWVKSLQKGDRLVATHYAMPSQSWLDPSWNEYHQANKRASQSGVDITRYFVYQTEDELDHLAKIMEEQQASRIRIFTVRAERMQRQILDIAVFIENFMGILSWGENRTPIDIDFFPLVWGSAHQTLIKNYEDQLARIGEEWKPRKYEFSMPSERKSALAL